MTLTHLEGEMAKRMVRDGVVSWFYTKPKETQALNRLVKKGVAVYDEKLLHWTLRDRTDDMRSA